MMMKLSVKHVCEIALGLVVGSLAGEAVNKVTEIVKEQVKNLKNKEA